MREIQRDILRTVYESLTEEWLTTSQIASAAGLPLIHTARALHCLGATGQAWVIFRKAMNGSKLKSLYRKK